jgi:hypothetical protein
MITIRSQLQFIYDTFTIWANTNGQAYSVEVVPDMVHMWEQLLNTSQSSRILIMYNGELIRGEFGIAAPLGRVDRKFMVVLSRGQSLTFPIATQYLQTTQNAKPLYEDVEEVRDICRALIFDPNWCEQPVDYLGTTPFPTDGSGRVLDAVSIEFSVGTQLGLIVSQPDQQVQTG